MERWFFSARRHVPRRLLETMRRECSGLVLSNVQPASAVPFLAAARRLRLPVVAHVASWDHTVGKGVISPHCDLYVVQNRVMEDDLRRYHGIEPERVRVTGWPQTDLFHRRRPRADVRGAPAAVRARPRPARSCSSPVTRRATRPTRGGSSSGSSGGGSRSRRERLQLLFRPHPRDSQWRERFAAALGRDGRRRAGGELHGPRRPRDAPPARGRRRLQRGTILLDALVGDRPAVCVLYDEGAPPGESWAAKNVVGKHYEELAASGAFYRAERSRRSSPGSSARSSVRTSSPAERRRAVEQVVGVVDGRAAERVVDAVVEALAVLG